MNGNQLQGLIGMLATLGILVLLALPSALGALRERRMDRQIREAVRTREDARVPTATRPAARPHTPRRAPRIQAHRTVRPRV